MSNLTPIPPQNSGFHLAAPMEINATPVPPKFRLKKYLFFLRKFWWIPLVTLILAVGGAIASFLLSPPQFVSSAKMWQTEKLQLPDGASFSEDAENYFGTMTSVLQSDTLRKLALANLANSGTNAVVMDRNGNPIGVDISVYEETRSDVFSVQAISSNPAFTSAYLDALMSAYLDYKRTVRQSVSGDTLASISAQIARLGQDLKNGQDALAQFEQSNDLVVLEQENEVAGSYLGKLRMQMADYELQSNLLDAVALEKSSMPVLGATNLANPLFEEVQGGALTTPAASSQNAYQQIESLKFQRQKLGKYLRPDHPKIVKLNEEIRDAQDLVDFYSTQNQQNITTARQALELRIQGVQQSINEWEDKVNYDSARIAQADNLKASIARNQSVYDRLASLMDNVDITRNIDQDSLAILQPASPASRSYGKLRSNISTASFGGLAFGLGLVLLVAIRDDRFSSIVEVTERLGDNVVGQVPEIPRLRGAGPLALLGETDDRHMYIESYRNLRSALLYLTVDGVRPKMVLITSAVPNEGKSTIASNLAAIMALGGSRVLLVDADLRKGHLHDILGLQSKPGFAELLLNPEDPLGNYLQISPKIPTLSFIARGSAQRNAGDLFLTNSFDRLLATFRERFDYVIIDSSPVFAADDSTTLAPKMDGTLFVVRSHFSRSNIVKEALELLYQRQATVLGLVLNRTDASGRSYHYYKYSEYHSTQATT